MQNLKKIQTLPKHWEEYIGGNWSVVLGDCRNTQGIQTRFKGRDKRHQDELWSRGLSISFPLPFVPPSCPPLLSPQAPCGDFRKD